MRRIEQLEKLAESQAPITLDVILEPDWYGANRLNPHSGEPPRVVRRQVGGKLLVDEWYPTPTPAEGVGA